VKAGNISLDNQIQANINASISALGVINPNYGEAIFNQQTQILNAQDAINELTNSLNLLSNFVQTTINE
jgi:hypothetical protein